MPLFWYTVAIVAVTNADDAAAAVADNDNDNGYDDDDENVDNNDNAKPDAINLLQEHFPTSKLQRQVQLLGVRQKKYLKIQFHA